MAEKQNSITVNGQTFVLNIKCRKNHTWQGTVNWVEEKKSLSFRSALELIKILDSAMDTVDPEEEPTEQW